MNFVSCQRIYVVSVFLDNYVQFFIGNFQSPELSELFLSIPWWESQMRDLKLFCFHFILNFICEYVCIRRCLNENTFTFKMSSYALETCCVLSRGLSFCFHLVSKVNVAVTFFEKFESIL